MRGSAWYRLPERSDTFWIQLIAWITLKAGRPMSRLLVYPITLYFVLTSPKPPREASNRFFRRVLERAPTFGDHYRQYHTFAVTLVDRLLVLCGQEDCLELQLEGLHHLEEATASGRGCILVGAHLGSFEIVRALGRLKGGLRVKSIMYGEATPAIMGFYRAVNPGLHEDLITREGPLALMGTDRYLEAGNCVALLGDRVLPGERHAPVAFLGGEARFPQTAALLSHMFGVPIILFTCLNTGWGRYAIHFDPLGVPSGSERRQRTAYVKDVLQRYADRLGHYCRQSPYNWFNFHDVWDPEA